MSDCGRSRRTIGPFRLGAAALALCGLFTALPAGRAVAADWPRSYVPPAPARGEYARWEGLYLGGVYGYSYLSTSYEDVGTVAALPQTTSRSGSLGGFIGYNFQWDELVVGFEGGYSRPDSLEVSASIDMATSTLKLEDYATFRARAGYAYGQFLPYAFLGAAAGRVSYATTEFGVVVDQKDSSYSVGFVAGLGMDVAITPNVFLRGEWEYIAFSKVGGIRSGLNTARVGVGFRF